MLPRSDAVRAVNVLQDRGEQKVNEREIFDVWHLEDDKWKIIYTERGTPNEKTEAAGTGVNAPSPERIEG